MNQILELKKVWIYGNGGFARTIRQFLKSQGVQIVGYIDRDGFYINDITGDVSLYENNKFPVVIGIFNHRDNPTEVVEFLEKLNVDMIFSPASLMNMFRGKGFNQYFLDTEMDYEVIGEELTELLNTLSDRESVRILEVFLNYRKTGDVRELIISGTASEQYLGMKLPSPFKENWLKGSLKWFDIGSFDGDTLRAMRDSGRDMKLDSFLCAEPDEINFKKLEITITGISATIKLLNVAIGEKSGFIDFSHEGTLSAKQSEFQSSTDSTKSVKVMTIDEICQNFKPTHIKMDIEGAEQSALLGGLGTIKQTRPKLAVSLYHKPMDFIELSKLLMNNLDSYSWFIRCYGAHGYDTILYGVPN